MRSVDVYASLESTFYSQPQVPIFFLRDEASLIPVCSDHMKLIIGAIEDEDLLNTVEFKNRQEGRKTICTVAGKLCPPFTVPFSPSSSSDTRYC